MRTPEEQAVYEGYLRRAVLTTPQVNELIGLVGIHLAILGYERAGLTAARWADEVADFFDERQRFLEQLEQSLKNHRVTLEDYVP